MMRRRDFLRLSGAAVLAPVAVVGVLGRLGERKRFVRFVWSEDLGVVEEVSDCAYIWPSLRAPWERVVDVEARRAVGEIVRALGEGGLVL